MFNRTLALIGTGNWGKNLARNFHELGALHTLCDLKETVTFPNVCFTSDFNEVLSNPEITQIAIAAPAALHYTLAKQSLTAGKDTYVEKPLCLDSKEAEELIALAKTKNRILMVGHLLQYHPCVIRLQELVKKGELGKLQYISSHRLNLGTIRTEENILWSFAPHDISVILSLCGQFPTEVRCTGEAYLTPELTDIATTTLRFADGLSAHIYTSWLNPLKEQKLVVIGSLGMAVFDDLKPWNEKLQFIRDPIQWIEGRLPKAKKSEPELISVSPKEPLQEECAHFLQCCKERTSPKTDGAEGLRVLKVLQKAQSSLQSKNENIHPTAVIDPGAEIGSGTKIWHFCHIMKGAKIGLSCNLGQNVVVSPDVILGRNVKVQNNVSIYTGVVCEDDVFLGPSMVFTNVKNPRSAVNRRGEYQKTLLKKGATVGANATIVSGIELGEYCFIGAGAVVTKEVKPFALMVGNPARQIGWMSRHGEKLDLPISAPKDVCLEAQCPKTGEIYRLEGNALFFIGIETPICR